MRGVWFSWYLLLMPRVRIESDERYPDYSIVVEEGEHAVEISDELLARIQACEKEYVEVQEILENLENKSHAAWLASMAASPASPR